MNEHSGFANPTRISASQRDDIIARFYEYGLESAQTLADKFGLQYNYARKLMLARGLLEPYGDKPFSGPSEPKPVKPKPQIEDEPYTGAPRYIRHGGHWYVLKSHMAQQLEKALR